MDGTHAAGGRVRAPGIGPVRPEPLTGLGELAARYTLLEELGRGGMAIVYRARDLAHDRDVAIKVVHSRFRGDVEATARMAREAETIAALQHPSIVQLYSVERPSDGSLALIMEYVPGETLKSVIARQGPMALDRALTILREVGDALAYAHTRGFVHRDVKPENIFIDDIRGRALLSDFGVARAMELDDGLTLTGASIGTPTYMSPEQVSGERVDGRSDLYSLALVGWEMLTGRRPWDGESLYEVIYRQKNADLAPLDSYRGDVPERVQFALETAMAKDRERRWQSAEEFLAELDAAAPESLRFEQWRRDRELARIAAPGVGLRRSWPADAATPTVRFRRGQIIDFGQRPDGGGAAYAAGAARAAPPPPSAAPPHAPPHGEWRVEPPAPPARRGWAFPVAVLALAAVALFALLSARRDGSARFADAELDSDSALGLPAGVLAAIGDANGTRGAAPATETPPLATPAPALPPAATTTASGTLDAPADNSPPRARGEDQAPAAPAATAAAAAPTVAPSSSAPPSASASAPASKSTAEDSRREAEEAPSAGSAAAVGPSVDFAPTRAVIAAGGSHSCALSAGGAAVCWGNNDDGQLGDGTQSGEITPVAVAGDFRFRAIAAGIAHTCGLTSDGSGYCWGSNDNGQLGDGTRAPRSAPVRIATNQTIELIRAGRSHSCAIAAGGRILCWGANASGELGDGSNSPRSTPVGVAADGRFRRLALGWSHSCALRSDGAAFCWGANKDGQLGDGSRSARAKPAEVRGESRFVSIAAGASHSCAVDESGVAYCWGDNRYGQLGTGRGDAAVPTKVATSARFVSITAGSVHTCALTRSGETLCWGRNTYGQLGDGTTDDRATPVKVTGNLSFVAVDAVGAHSCAATGAGARYCWGYNAEAQLGDSSRTHRSSPARVSAPSAS